MNYEDKMYEERMHDMFQKRAISISILACVVAFVVFYFMTGFLINSVKDEAEVAEICKIHNFVDMNRDYEQLIAGVKKEFPEYKMKIEIDNLEERTVLTIYKNSDYQVRVNYDGNLNYFSSRLIDNYAANKIPCQILISISAAILTMITSIFIGATYVYKKMQLIVS